MTMIYLGYFDKISGPETQVGYLGLAALFVCGMWALLREISRSPAALTPEPWSAEISRQLEEEDCVPLCHHCLAPHEPGVDFCPQCGTAVGACTNLLPFPYVFSIGQALRVGTTEHFKRSALTVGGFFLFGLVQYWLFAPVYWFRLVRNLCDSGDSQNPDASRSAGNDLPAGAGEPQS